MQADKEQQPKVHYKDVYDLDHFKNVTLPILLQAIEEVETMPREGERESCVNSSA